MFISISYEKIYSEFNFVSIDWFTNQIDLTHSSSQDNSYIPLSGATKCTGLLELVSPDSVTELRWSWYSVPGAKRSSVKLSALGDTSWIILNLKYIENNKRLVVFRHSDETELFV